MNTLVYSLQDFFEFTFKFMPKIGNVVNLTFMAIITFFTIYWIIQMKKNPDKVR
jgi:hypothetical protein